MVKGLERRRFGGRLKVDSGRRAEFKLKVVVCEEGQVQPIDEAIGRATAPGFF